MCFMVPSEYNLNPDLMEPYGGDLSVGGGGVGEDSRKDELELLCGHHCDLVNYPMCCEPC